MSRNRRRRPQKLSKPRDETEEEEEEVARLFSESWLESNSHLRHPPAARDEAFTGERVSGRGRFCVKGLERHGLES